jgi:multidrug resistance efflux pump
LLVLLLGVLALVFWGQYSRRGAELYYSGTIEAIQSNLAFQVSGRVQEVLTDEGRSAGKAEVLAVLDRREFMALRDQALANLQRAEQNLRQLETVLEVNRNVLPAEVDRAAAAVKALQAQLAEAEFGLRSQEIERARLAAEASQVVVGIVFNTLALGLASYAYRVVVGETAKPMKAPMLPVAVQLFVLGS